MNPVIAIDGPAGSGKSTVAAALARRLGVPHVDTGAYYRAATLAVLRTGADPSSAAEVLAVLDRVHIARRAGHTLLDGEDVEQRIRTDQVTAAVSAVAAHPDVRRRLVVLQRAEAGEGAVVEGRDAASVIVPDAELKVWLTAPPAVRAARRAAQQGHADEAVIERVTTQLLARDDADSPNTFLDADAVVIDTADLTVDAVVARVVDLVRAA